MIRLIVISFWGLIFALSGSAALAGSAVASGSNLVINGISAVRFAVKFGTRSPGERATRAAEKLRELPYWGAINVGVDGLNRSLLIGEEEILEVSAADAAAAHITVDALAHAWASRVQNALDLPPLKVSDNFVRLPIGTSQLVAVTGSEAQKATISVTDPKVARVTRNSRGWIIEGVSVGSTIVSVEAGKDQENVNVTVLPYAVRLPQTVTAEVIGAPASADVVKGIADYALKTKLIGLPDAQVTFGKTAFKPLPSGETATYSIKVEASSPSGASANGFANIKITNKSVSRTPADYLWYSNSPETVKQSQSLFSSTLKQNQSVRFLYHHMNGTMQDIYLRVEAVNEGKVPAVLSLTYGDSKPSIDPVRAGFFAASQFLHHWADGSGDVVSIPPGSVLPISLRRLSPGETASGLCELKLLSGPSDLLVRTDALPPLRLDDKWADTIFTSTPWHEVGTHPINDYDNIPCEANPHIYAAPHVDSTLSYVVGGRPGYYRIGQHPFSQVDQEGSLDGNFGVFDSILTRISNPNAFPADVEIVFEASAGYAGGLFLINGQFVSTSLLKPKASQRIAKYHLAPNAALALTIVTLPISGSSYPATLYVRAIVPRK